MSMGQPHGGSETEPPDLPAAYAPIQGYCSTCNAEVQSAASTWFMEWRAIVAWVHVDPERDELHRAMGPRVKILTRGGEYE